MPRVTAQNPHPQTLHRTLGIVDQMQPRPLPVPGQPAQHHLAAVDPQQPLFIRKLRPDLVRQQVGVRRVRLRELPRADPDIEIHPRIGRRQNPEQQIVPGQQIHQLPGIRAAIVDQSYIGHRGQVRRPQAFQKRQHARQRVQTLGIGVNQSVRAVGVRLHRRKRSRIALHVVINPFLPGPLNPPSVPVQPRTPAGRRLVHAVLDAGRGQFLHRMHVHLGGRAHPVDAPFSHHARILIPNQARQQRSEKKRHHTSICVKRISRKS